MFGEDVQDLCKLEDTVIHPPEEVTMTAPKSWSSVGKRWEYGGGCWLKDTLSQLGCITQKSSMVHNCLRKDFTLECTEQTPYTVATNLKTVKEQSVKRSKRCHSTTQTSSNTPKQGTVIGRFQLMF